MSFIIDPIFHMWFALFMTVVIFVFLAKEKIPLEVTAVVLLAVLILFGEIFPLPDEAGGNRLSAASLLSGFSSPSLIALLALLVTGQALIQTAAMTPISRFFMILSPRHAIISLFIIFVFILVTSAFMNNTPQVILAIPIIQALGARIGLSASRTMMPLSFIAILGGMPTLIGSSTNLLVSTALIDLGYTGLEFFEFVVPGSIMAVVGAIYCATVLPFLLPKRASLAEGLQGEEENILAELDIAPDSSLVGEPIDNDGGITKLMDVSVRMVQRRGGLILPPFDEDFKIEDSDILIVSTTRTGLMDVLSAYPAFLLSNDELSHYKPRDEAGTEKDMRAEEEGKTGSGDVEDIRVLCEVMIPPHSEFIGKSVEQADFQNSMNCLVLGIQRQATVVRRRLHQMRLSAGDVLLVAGLKKDIYALRDNPEMIVLAGSRKDIPVKEKAGVAIAIFMATIFFAATGILSIATAAVTGAVAVLLTRCMTIPQVIRAFDRQIFFLVGASLALGTFLEVSGAAEFIANALLSLPAMNTPLWAISALFILIAITTNLLTNNACAILFTPIAVNLAIQVGADPSIFAVAVIFAANCSFASPIGYQTNLLVMGPGHYKFKDFMVAGVPLVLLMWITYIGIAKYYYGL